MRFTGIAAVLAALGAYGPARAEGGEPFEQGGLMQGCSSEAGPLVCSLVAEGWFYMVTEGAGTPGEVIGLLLDMEVNTPVQFGGEILNMGDITIEVVLGFVEQSGDDPFAEVRARLQGDWLVIGAEGMGMTVEGSEMTFTSADGVLDASLIAIAPACQDEPVAALPVLYARRMGGDPEAYCLRISALDDVSLDLVDVGADTLLRFERAE